MKNKIRQIVHFCLSTLLFVAMAACSENTLYIEGNQNGGGEMPAWGSTEVNGHFALNGKKVESVASVETFKSSSAPIDGNFTATVFSKSSPQIITGTNAAGDIMFLYRGYANESDNIEVNEYTTATALLTMHPAFWCLSADEYGTLESTMKSLAGYDNLVSEVRKVLESGKSLMTRGNRAVIDAMNTCYRQLLKKYSDGNKSAVASMTTVKATRKAADDGSYEYFPIEFSPEYNTMNIREVGLAPVYECNKTVNGVVSETKLIVPNSAYGLTDFMSFIANGICLGDFVQAYHDVNYGEWIDFGMTTPDDYTFNLNRNTSSAKGAQTCFYITDVCSMLGLLAHVQVKGKDAKVYTDLLSESDLNSLQDVINIFKLSIDPGNYVNDKWIESIYYMILDYVYRHGTEKLRGIIDNSDFLKKFTLGLAVYDEAASVLSLVGRIYMDNTVPDEIEQCFSQHNNVITTCNGTGISIRSGNNQVVESARKLDEPIVFSVICNLGQRVKVEVTKGNGTLSKYYLTPKAFDGTTQYVSTEWTLGNKTGEQTLTAYIVDTATDKKQSPECVVTACISKGSLLTSIGNAFLFTYDNKGRKTSMTDRTCMLVEPDPTEIVTSRLEYKNNDGKELSRIVSTGDGETDRWYDIKYNTDGYIKSFKWSGTDEYGTEYGTGQFEYDNDGHIIRIVSGSDEGNTYLSFTWDNGNLVKIGYYDPTADYVEDMTDNQYISYGDQKNVHRQFPAAMMMLELGPLFYSGQVGVGMDNLPTKIIGTDMGLNLKYSLRNDGYIMRESMRLTNNPTMGYDFNYSYKEAPSSAKGVSASSPVLRMPAKGMKSRKHLRMFRLKR